jgi:hypothetical protein
MEEGREEMTRHARRVVSIPVRGFLNQKVGGLAYIFDAPPTLSLLLFNILKHTITSISVLYNISTCQSLVYGSTDRQTQHIKMKYSFALLALVAVASAQSIPACAQPCIAAAVSSATTCGASDLACQCQPANEAAIQAAATSCVLKSCSSSDAAGMSH